MQVGICQVSGVRILLPPVFWRWIRFRLLSQIFRVAVGAIQVWSMCPDPPIVFYRVILHLLGHEIYIRRGTGAD
jgi:hypothetical protein